MAKRRKNSKNGKEEKIHNHIHISIKNGGDKSKKSNRRQRRNGGGGGGGGGGWGGRGGATSVSTNMLQIPNVIVPQYNKHQYLDTSTAIQRETPFRRNLESETITPKIKHENIQLTTDTRTFLDHSPEAVKVEFGTQTPSNHGFEEMYGTPSGKLIHSQTTSPMEDMVETGMKRAGQYSAKKSVTEEQQTSPLGATSRVNNKGQTIQRMINPSTGRPIDRDEPTAKKSQSWKY